MTNGKLSSWFVAKHLAKHSKHRAFAPDSNEFFPCLAWSDGVHVEFITEYPDGKVAGAMPVRKDWTVLDEHKNPVVFLKEEV